MNKNNTFNTIISIIGLLGIGYAVSTHSKMSKISEKLDKSINDLVNDTKIYIPDKLIDEAVEKHVAEEVKKAVVKAANDAVYEVKHDISKTVSAAVNAEYDRVQESVLKEITASAARIDVDKVRRDVESAAEREAIKKFDANLDDILRSFKNNLENTSKTCDMFRSMVMNGSNQNREFVLKLG